MTSKTINIPLARATFPQGGRKNEKCEKLEIWGKVGKGGKRWKFGFQSYLCWGRAGQIKLVGGLLGDAPPPTSQHTPQPKRSGHPPQSKFLGLLKECLMGILVKTAFRPHQNPTKSSKNVGLYSKTHMVEFPCSEPYKTCRILIILEPETQNGLQNDQKALGFPLKVYAVLRLREMLKKHWSQSILEHRKKLIKIPYRTCRL